MTTETTRRRSALHWWMLAGVPVVAVVLYFLTTLEPDPRGFGTHEKLGFQPCLPMRLWNVPCPGCGVTTSVSLTLHGRIWDAIANQPFGFVVAGLLLAYLVVVPLFHLRGADLGAWIERPPARWLIFAMSVLIVGSWAWKFAQVWN